MAEKIDGEFALSTEDPHEYELCYIGLLRRLGKDPFPSLCVYFFDLGGESFQSVFDTLDVDAEPERLQLQTRVKEPAENVNQFLPSI